MTDQPLAGLGKGLPGLGVPLTRFHQSYSPFVFGTRRADDITVDHETILIATGRGADDLEVNADALFILTGRGADDVTLNADAVLVDLGRGNDALTANGYVDVLFAGRGRDDVTLNDGAGYVDLGRGRDSLTVTELVDYADGGRGKDTLNFTFEAGQVDISIDGDTVTFIGRFSGQEMIAEDFEVFAFADATYTKAELDAAFDTDTPYIQVGGGTQTVTVNDPDPSISVIWDRVIQEAVIETGDGPTVASRAYSMMHTAMYDAWSSYDATAVRVSFDQNGDNVETTGTDADKAKAMSFAALTVLLNLFPDQANLYETVMVDRLGYTLDDDGSLAAEIGIDAGMDLLALRGSDGSNQAGGYADTTGYSPENPNPLEINDITRWTPENVPVDPEDGGNYQQFLTPQWGTVESFAILEDPLTNETDFSAVRPEAPQPFFATAYAGSTLDVAAGTITLDAVATVGTESFAAGDVITIADVDRDDLIGNVINKAFIDQAIEVVDFSANLTDEQKIIAEFWEDGGGTAFPPGTWMTFAQFVSARDDHSLDQDAQLFFMMGNAVMDAGIATWEAKTFYDYVRPVRAIRELGELGLIGDPVLNTDTNEIEYFIDAWAGVGLGTQSILASDFVTFQLPGGNVSPPFAEYTSGHSAFSAAGAEVLYQFTGSDTFGGSVTFDPDSILFEPGVPEVETTLAWSTFSEAADEAGLSRLYGGIHFEEGDVNGRDLGRAVGEDAYTLAMEFINGTATDADRPFYETA